MNTNNKYRYVKICENCKREWDICRGIDCQCLDGACCEDFNSKDMENRAADYFLKKVEI